MENEIIMNKLSRFRRMVISITIIDVVISIACLLLFVIKSESFYKALYSIQLFNSGYESSEIIRISNLISNIIGALIGIVQQIIFLFLVLKFLSNLVQLKQWARKALYILFLIGLISCSVGLFLTILMYFVDIPFGITSSLEVLIFGGLSIYVIKTLRQKEIIEACVLR